MANLKIKLIIMGGMLALLLPFAACSSVNAEPAPAMATADYSLNGQKVEVAADGSLELTLECDPNLGYEWALSGISDQNVLKLAGQQFKLPEPEDGPDCLGKEVWSFQALGKGSSTIFMEYMQPWQKRYGPEDRFKLTVDVK